MRCHPFVSLASAKQMPRGKRLVNRSESLWNSQYVRPRALGGRFEYQTHGV